MPKEYINPESLFPSLEHGFSQIVVASGRKSIYISGQTAWDAKKRLIGVASLEQQARQAFRNVQTAVEAAGGTLADVVALRIYIVNYKPEDADVVGRVLREFFFGESCPVSTWVGISSLAVSHFLIGNRGHRSAGLRVIPLRHMRRGAGYWRLICLPFALWPS